MWGGKGSDDDANGDEQSSELYNRELRNNAGFDLLFPPPFELLNISASRSLSQQSSIHTDLSGVLSSATPIPVNELTTAPKNDVKGYWDL